MKTVKDLTIHDIYVEMESQEQCDRMKKLCVDNKLPYSLLSAAFDYDEYHINVFTYDFGYEEFDVSFITPAENRRRKDFFVSEKEFINILKQMEND